MMFSRPAALVIALLLANDGISNADPAPTSPESYPSPWGVGGPDGWDAAYAKAHEFVSKLTLLEKVNLTTGTGNQADLCTGNTGSIPRLGFRTLCLQDGPVGIRYSESAIYLKLSPHASLGILSLETQARLSSGYEGPSDS